MVDKLPPRIKKIVIGIVGGVVFCVGIIAIPYPGPGWLIVFIGLSILATEFTWAQRLHDYARGRYNAWQAWLVVQPRWVRVGFWVVTATIVVLTIWLLNGYGMINNWLHLGADWLRAPWVR